MPSIYPLLQHQSSVAQLAEHLTRIQKTQVRNLARSQCPLFSLCIHNTWLHCGYNLVCFNYKGQNSFLVSYLGEHLQYNLYLSVLQDMWYCSNNVLWLYMCVMLSLVSSAVFRYIVAIVCVMLQYISLVSSAMFHYIVAIVCAMLQYISLVSSAVFHYIVAIVCAMLQYIRLDVRVMLQ